MLRRTCRECGAEMVRKQTLDGVTIFCETCDSETPFDEVVVEPYCPDCGEKISVCSKCCKGFFCGRCNSLKSSKRIIWKPA